MKHRAQTTRFLACLVTFGAAACSAESSILRVGQTDAGHAQSGSGTNGGAAARRSDGDASNGGASVGGAGGTAMGGGANIAGTTATGGTTESGDATPDGPAPRCENCWLLDASVTWDYGAMLYADGERIVWQTGRDTYDKIATLNIDGTNPQSFNVTDCWVSWYNPTIYAGYVYFNNISRVPVDFGPGSSCETVFSIDTSVPAPPVADGYFLDTLGSAFWENIYEHDVHRLVRVDLSSFKTRDESNPNALIVEAADATSLYGHDNPGGGSSSYRLLRYDRTSKATTVMSTYVAIPRVLAVDGASMYLDSDGSLFKVPKDTTLEVDPTPIPGPNREWKLLVDGTDVVYFKWEENAFHRMPMSGGPIRTFPTGPFVVRGVTWDSTRYFVMLSEPNNTLYYRLVRIPK
jgi:hypothetical protein